MRSLLIFGFILILNAKVECNIEEIDTVKLGAEMIDANLREKEDNVVVSPLNAVKEVSFVETKFMKSSPTVRIYPWWEDMWETLEAHLKNNEELSGEKRHFNGVSALNNLILSLSNTSVDFDSLAKTAENKILVSIEEVDAWILDSSKENTKFIHLAGLKRVNSIHSEKHKSQVFRISAADTSISLYIIVPSTKTHAGLLELNKKLSADVIKDIQDEMDQQSKGFGRLKIPKIDFTSTVDLLQINEDVGLFNDTEIGTKMNKITQTVNLNLSNISGKDLVRLIHTPSIHNLVLDSPFIFLVLDDETQTSFLQGAVEKF